MQLREPVTAAQGRLTMFTQVALATVARVRLDALNLVAELDGFGVTANILRPAR